MHMITQGFFWFVQATGLLKITVIYWHQNLAASPYFNSSSQQMLTHSNVQTHTKSIVNCCWLCLRECEGPECYTEKLLVPPPLSFRLLGRFPNFAPPASSSPVVGARRGKVWLVWYRETSLVYKPPSAPPLYGERGAEDDYSFSFF